MANLHHRGSAKGPQLTDPHAVLDSIRAFLSSCRVPAVLEQGEEVVPLTEGEFTVEVSAGRLCLEFQSGHRTVSRRVLSVERHRAGVLECTIQRFAGKEGKLRFLDLHRPQTASTTLRGSRESFTEQFRRILHRQFPGWEITALTCGMDLQRSFSPVFPRACLRRGNQTLAALACPHLREESGVLTFALIWHRHLVESTHAGMPSQLCIFLPDNAGSLTAQRLRWLTGRDVTVRLFRFNAHGSAGEVDPQDLGNLDTRVSLTAFGDTNLNPGGPTAGVTPERTLEIQLRSGIQTIDASLRPRPVHGQVLTFSAGDRDLIDLLAVSVAGSLAVLELKVTEDVHLPLQALDYWMRVAWHARNGELNHLFPGVPLDGKPPRLLLIAPAMSFHSTNATVLSYFSPGIEVERIGINEGWRQGVRVVMRLRGADSPISHGSFE